MGGTGHRRKSNNHVIGECAYDWSFGAGKWAWRKELQTTIVPILGYRCLKKEYPLGSGITIRKQNFRNR